MVFKPRLVGGTDVGDKPKAAKSEDVDDQTERYVLAVDKLGNFKDKDFDKRLGEIMDATESLENQRPHRERQVVHREKRREYGVGFMTNSNLKEIVMSTDKLFINRKPEYYTAVCGEIIERVLGNVTRIIERN